MAKKDFGVISIFKIIIWICIRNVEFCGKTSEFLPKRCLFIPCISCLNENELNKQVCILKYVEKEFSNPTSQGGREAKTKNIVQLQKHHF